jgi:hypothetical protein
MLFTGAFVIPEVLRSLTPLWSGPASELAYLLCRSPYTSLTARLQVPSLRCTCSPPPPSFGAVPLRRGRGTTPKALHKNQKLIAAPAPPLTLFHHSGDNKTTAYQLYPESNVVYPRNLFIIFNSSRNPAFKLGISKIKSQGLRKL